MNFVKKIDKTVSRNTFELRRTFPIVHSVVHIHDYAVEY